MRAKSQFAEQRCILRHLLSRDRIVLAATFFLFCLLSSLGHAQRPTEESKPPETTGQKIEQLTAALARAESQMESYQKQLLEMRNQLTALRQQMMAEKGASPTATQPSTTSSGSEESSSGLAATIAEIREHQAIEDSQIATHDVTKVETQSKYPLKVSGLILFNSFVNTRQVDTSASPAYALSGPGSTGLSLRQTVLGFDARGPHLFGATSYGDLRVDFFANGAQSNYASSGVLRLRTAHAGLNWSNTEAFVQLDRTILEPNQPSSLVAVAQPELAWAGNLWNWNPQIGLTHQFAISDSSRIKAQAALIDTWDPKPPGTTSTSPVTQTEFSRWPGTEGRIAFQNGMNGGGFEVGAGGYFSPHRYGDGDRFDAWAGTIDLRMQLTRRFEMTANSYRGQALAGLGAGGYVNYYDVYKGATATARALDTIGGWAQLKARAGERVEINAGYGIDNPFSKDIHAATSSSGSPSSAYPGLARNRAAFANVIYSPSAYLLFSLEYKRLWTNYAYGPANFSDSIGIGAGYKF
jgi:hypothetical protein